MSWATYQPEKPPNRRMFCCACIEVGLCVFLKIPIRIIRRSPRTKSSKQCVCGSVFTWLFIGSCFFCCSWNNIETLDTCHPISPCFMKPKVLQQAGRPQSFFQSLLGVHTPSLPHPHLYARPTNSRPFTCTERFPVAEPRKTAGKPREIGLQVPAIFHHLDVFILNGFGGHVLGSVIQKIY